MSVVKSFPYQLYLVISEADCNGKNFLDVAEQAILGGVDIIQLREKRASDEEFLEKAKRLKEITDKYEIPLIVNDNAFVAKEIDAFGIHVGNNDVQPSVLRHALFQQKMIGYSIEYLDQLGNQETIHSDYLGISPVFRTGTKTDTVTEWGLEGIRKIRQLTEKPLVAIGNIHLDNAKAVIDAGADCIAVVSEICASANPQKSAFHLKNEINK
ncbi:MAG: thiamine phosphate synthase [Pedobacter sp.]|nr:MAG: thiamine phosphate synthase [Pedobacter sp.]